MRLVPLTPTNYHLLRPLRNRNRHVFFNTKLISVAEHARWFKHFTSIQYFIYEGNVLIGSLGLSPLASHKAEIHRVMLAAKKFHRRGYMTKALTLLYKKHPYAEYSVSVKKDNLPAIKFYLKNGFTIEKEEAASYHLLKKHPQLSRQSFIPLLQPACSQAEIKAVNAVLRSGWWGLGPVTEKLEEKFAQFVGVPYAIALNSATAALHLAVHMLKKKHPDKTNLIVPALTFISTAAVGVYENLEIRFADIDPDTLCLDSADVTRKIDQDTLAVIPVHYAGYLTPPVKTYVPIIEDCAHAAGTPGAGLQGLMGCWSFHPVKNIACGDGGMLTTKDPQLYQEAKRLRWLGIDQDTWSRERLGYNWEYHLPSLGYKYHLNDIQSAIALAQLNRLPSLNQKRQIIAKHYLEKLKGLPVSLPPQSGNWHLFTLRLHHPTLRPAFITFLREHAISAGVHYKPLHHYPVFGYNRPLPVTDAVWPTLVDLPIHPGLTRHQQDYIISVIRKFFQTVG